MTTKKNKPGQGRKPLGQDRGGLALYPCRLFADQIDALQGMVRGEAAIFIRLAIDEALRIRKKNAPRVGMMLAGLDRLHEAGEE